MKPTVRLALACLLPVAFAVAAVQAAGDAPIALTPDQLKWVPNPAAPDQVKMAVAWGDPAQGAHGAFHKFAAGFAAPLHTHSANTKLVVLQGTMALAGEDGKETRFPVGSFMTQPNTYKHVTKCLAGAECMIYAEVDGKWDLKPVATK
jgi:hypothetical protein